MKHGRHDCFGAPITENGCAGDEVIADDGHIYDTDRIMFVRAHLTQLQRAGADGVPVKGCFYWSAMDNLECQHIRGSTSVGTFSPDPAEAANDCAVRIIASLTHPHPTYGSFADTSSQNVMSAPFTSSDTRKPVSSCAATQTCAS